MGIRLKQRHHSESLIHALKLKGVHSKSGSNRNAIQQLPHSEELLRLAEIGEATAIMVHEARNPLTTILLGLKAFQKLELPESAQARLALALEEAKRLQNLLNEVLLYAKSPTLQCTDLDLNALVQESINSIRALPTVAERQIAVVPAVSNIWIRGDRDKLRQVLINLIINACEAVTEGELITCQIELNVSTKRVRVQMHNGGEPISPGLLPLLTKPFFTTKPAGNGLGLAIVKQIIEAHGGELVIESSAGMGTTVNFWLPVDIYLEPTS